MGTLKPFRAISTMQQRIVKYVLALAFVLLSQHEVLADSQNFETIAAFEKQTCSILRDRDGFLWIGTIYGGLIKFNGLDAITFEKKNGGAEQ